MSTPQQQRRKEFIKQWEIVKQSILVRDNFSCVICGARTDIVHHILSKNAWASLRLDPRNLVAVCPLHHKDDANTQPMAQVFFDKIKHFPYDWTELPFSFYID
jgi:hypothetical protein